MSYLFPALFPGQSMYILQADEEIPIAEVLKAVSVGDPISLAQYYYI